MCQFPCRTTSSPANKNRPMDAHPYCWYFKSRLCLNLTAIPSGFFFFFLFLFNYYYYYYYFISFLLPSDWRSSLPLQSDIRFNFRFSSSFFILSSFSLLPSPAFYSLSIFYCWRSFQLSLLWNTLLSSLDQKRIGKIKNWKEKERKNNRSIGWDGESSGIFSLETMAFPFMRAFLAVL